MAITVQVARGCGSCRGSSAFTVGPKDLWLAQEQKDPEVYTTGCDSLCRALSPVPASVSQGLPASHNVGTTGSL